MVCLCIGYLILKKTEISSFSQSMKTLNKIFIKLPIYGLEFLSEDLWDRLFWLLFWKKKEIEERQQERKHTD